MPRRAAQLSVSRGVPTVGVSLGLSYEVERLKISGGYRMERFFDVLDGGADERSTVDRGFDGPFVKLSIGFGS